MNFLFEFDVNMGMCVGGFECWLIVDFMVGGGLGGGEVLFNVFNLDGSGNLVFFVELDVN